MVNYECKRCGYFTKLKGNFKNHLNRKNVCKCVLEDISIDEIRSMYKLGDNCEQPKTTQNNPKTTQIVKNHSCIYCSKDFNRKWHLSRHLPNCKKKDTIELQLKEENIELKNAVKDLQLELKHKQCINNTTNNINVVIMNNYGEENIKYSKKYLTGIIKGAFSAIPKLIEDTHFNKNYPENSNIRITNKKLPYAEVRKNGVWELQDKESFIDLLVDDKYYILEDHYNEMDKSNLSEFQKDIIENFKTKYTSSDDDLMKTLKKKTELVILNKSK